MPRKKEVDAKKLLEAIEAGTPGKLIMEQFGLKTKSQFKAAYLDALVTEGKAPGIVGARRGPNRKAGDSEDRNIQVNKRGSLIVPAEMVQAFGYELGDQFVLRKTKSGLVLKKG